MYNMMDPLSGINFGKGRKERRNRSDEVQRKPQGVSMSLLALVNVIRQSRQEPELQQVQPRR